MASVMSGKYRGVQQLILEKVGHPVFFIPCQAHRTNTATEHSCSGDTSAIIANMFGTFEALYVFF